MDESKLQKLSRIKNKNIRRLITQMAFQWEVIKRMEQYHKEHYENKKTNAICS